MAIQETYILMICLQTSSFEVERAGDRLVNKAHQLIGNETTNLTECFMSVRAKMNGGKQTNRIQSGSFEHRCMTAGLSITLGHGVQIHGDTFLVCHHL